MRAIATDETAKKQNLVVNNSECFNDSCKTSEAGNIFKNLRFKNINRLIIGNLNINSISGKFDQLKTIIQGKIDMLVITETKLDASFPKSQFLIEWYSQPYRMDRNRNGGGVLVYVREDIPSK